MRHHAKFLLALAALMSLFVCAATASADFKYTGTFSGPGTEPGQLETPGRAAVEQSTGNLFVVDSGNDRVQIFKPNEAGTADYLTAFGAGELSEPWGIAIAEGGGQTSVYVADAGNGRIVKYDSDEAETPSFTIDASFTSPIVGSGEGEVGSFKAALAIDPTAGDLLLADYPNKLIQRFEADGTFDEAFDGTDGTGSPGAFQGPIDLAINSGGDVYVVDANGPDIGAQEGTSKVLRYSGSGTFKNTLGPVGTHERPATVAVNPATEAVIVTGDQDAVYEGGPPPFTPALQLFDSADNPLPTPKLDDDALNDTVSGVAFLAGAVEDRFYVVLDVGRYFGTPYGNPHIQSFVHKHPQSPVVVSQSATPAFHEAILRAKVHPGHDATEYRFEYGTTIGYGEATASRTIPAGEDPVDVSAAVRGLLPGTTYHFRIVVSNSVGAVEGPDQTFTTGREEPTSGNCPNEEIRTAQGNTFLPECRAYEMVSPPDKNSNDVAVTASRTQSAPDGNAVTYISTGAFAGAPGTGAVAQYLSSRGVGGWSTRPLNPFQHSDGASFLKNSGFKAFGDDLQRGIFVGGDPVLDPAAPPGVRSLYTADLSNGDFSLVSGTKGSDPAQGMLPEPFFSGVSEDFTHVLFQSAAALTDDAPDDGTSKLYESVNGEVRLAGIVDGGVPAAGGSVAGNGAGTPPFVYTNNYTQQTMSADGSRIVFKELATNQLYSRVNGTITLHVSESQRTVPDPEGSQQVTFRGASVNGKRILFTSCEKLTDDSTAEAADCEFGSGSHDLYQFDADSGDLTVLSPDSEPADGLMARVLGVIGASDDGSYVYFVAGGRLTSDTPLNQLPHLYLWHAGSVSYVADFSASDGSEGDVWAADYAAGQQARVSPSGQHALFISFARQPGIDDAGEREAYLYEASNEQLTCISCGTGGPDGRATLSQVSPGVPAGKAEYRNRALLPDGSKAFFSTPRALVPQDHNGRYDAYEWDSASESVSLVSTGAAASDSYFVEASVDGRDVFFVTRQRLSPRDIDNNNDLYDARSGGGFVEPIQPPVRCEGERCQGEISPPPAPPDVGSEASEDQGDPKAKLRVARTMLVKGAAGFLTVRAPGAGKLTLNGPLLSATRKQVASAGRFRLPLRLSEKGRASLSSLGLLVTRARVGFIPPHGDRQRARLKVTFVTGQAGRGAHRTQAHNTVGGK